MTTPRARFLAARYAYVALVLLATLAQLEFSPDLAAAARRLARTFTPSLGWRDAIDGLRNLALFGGLGVVWVVTSLSGKVVDEVRRATWVGFGLSATVETLQVFSPVRNASLFDLGTNTLGAVAGAVLVALLFVAVRRAKGAPSYVGLPTFLVGGAYGLAALCEALTPLFGSAPLPAVPGGPVARLRLALDFAFPLSLIEVPLFDLLLFAPAGFLAVMVLRERGGDSHRLWPLVAGVGSALLLTAHVAHGAFGLPIRWEAAITHAAAWVFGSWAAQRWLAPLTQVLRGAARARALLFAYAGLLVLWGWRPLLPQTSLEAILAQLTPERLVPLHSLAGRVDVFSALHVAQQFLLYLPLGSVLAVWPLRLEGRWSHLTPALALALCIEVGHIVIAGRYFDLTNALVAWAGLGVGWIVVRRSTYAPYGAAMPPPR